MIRRKIALTGLGLAALFLFSGCAPKDSTGQNAASEAASAPVTVAQQEESVPTEQGDVTHPVYEMELALDTAGAESYAHLTLSGDVQITFTNTSDDEWTQVCLRDYSPAMLEAEAQQNGDTDYAAHTAIGQVSENGITLSVQEQADPTVVMVTLQTPMAPGERRTLTVEFTESIPCGGERTGYFPVLEDGSGMSLSLGPFYPVLSVYENGQWLQNPYFTEGECFYTPCGDYTVTLSLPDEFTVVSTGTEGKTAEGLWRMTASNVRDFGIIASDCFAMCSDTVEGITVRSWYYSGSERDESFGRQALQAAAEAVSAYTALYGAYPYDTLDVAEATYNYGGMEYPAMVRIADGYAYELTADGSGDGDLSLRSCVAHEVAHQWFYGVVGNDQYAEAWLDEGFARFSELVWLESIGADPVLQDSKVSGWAENAAEYDGVLIDQPYSSFEFGIGYGQVIYDKSAYFLWQLRKAMGADAFSRFIGAWYSDNMFSEVTTEQFRQAVLDSCPDNADVAALLTQYLG